MLRLLCTVALCLSFAGQISAQEPATKPAETKLDKPDETSSDEDPEDDEATPGTTPVAPVQGRGAGENLLGQADTARGEGRRNENVQINLVDNNAARDAASRLGPTATIIEEFRVERSYFSAEYGNAGRGLIHVQPQRGIGFHGNLSGLFEFFRGALPQ